MKKESFIKLWKTTQISLFFLPIIILMASTPYTISYDKGYVETVNPRVLDGGGGDFNIEGAVEDWKDTEGIFYYKEWKLQHLELYWIYNLLKGGLYGVLLQAGNMFWEFVYCRVYDDYGGGGK